MMTVSKWLSLLVRIVSALSPHLPRHLLVLRSATDVPYIIRVWDKNGDLFINGQPECPAANASQCHWYYRDVLQGVQTRVSNTSTLDLRAQFSEYGEYYLMNQNRSIVKYELVVPNADAGTPYESNFLSLHPCHTGMPNSIGFWYTSNINRRAIDSKQPCDLRWNGLPHCAFTDKLCYYNGSNLMINFSVQCHLDYEKKDIYISSNPMKIGLVENLPSCPSEDTSNITYESITTSSTIATPTPTLAVSTNVTQSAPTDAANITSTTSMVSTLSSTTHVTVTLTATPVHSGSATINATHETSTPISSPSATTSEQKTNTIIAAVCTSIVLFLLCLLLLIIILKVYSRRRARKGRNNSNNTDNNIGLQPRWKQEINDNRVDMAESLTTVITPVLWHLCPLLSSFEYNEISSISNEMKRADALLNTICSREDDKLVIKFCDALEKAKHDRWTYLRDYCNSNNTESYDV